MMNTDGKRKHIIARSQFLKLYFKHNIWTENFMLKVYYNLFDMKALENIMHTEKNRNWEKYKYNIHSNASDI